MEQPPAVATTPAAAAAPTPQQEKQQEKQLAWASPPRPPFAGEGIDNNADANAGASTSTSSTSAAESALAAHYSRKLVKLRALVADAHFRGKDLAGKDEIHDAAVSAGGAQFACSADPQPLRRFLAAPRLKPELAKWLDPEYQGERD